MNGCHVRYWHKADIRGIATFCPLLDKSGQTLGRAARPRDRLLLISFIPIWARVRAYSAAHRADHARPTKLKAEEMMSILLRLVMARRVGFRRCAASGYVAAKGSPYFLSYLDLFSVRQKTVVPPFAATDLPLILKRPIWRE